MSAVAAPPAGSSVAERAAFTFVRYGSVWEDADLLCEALAPVAARARESGGARLLSIASAGDNVLALLTLDPAEVVAVDLSAAQLACLEIRIAAFRCLEDRELLAFLGVTPCRERLATYSRLRAELSAGARAFWDGRPEAVREGVIRAGKFERYFHLFRRFVLPLIHGPRTVSRLLEARSPAEQRAFYAREWDTWRWRLLFRLFVSRPVMGRLGRDPAFFTHVEGSVSSRILERTRAALTELPVRSNPYLGFIMTGTFPKDALPRYLRPEHTRTIRERLERVRLVQGSVPEACGGCFDGFNLSDVFEYMSPAEAERCYEGLLERAGPGARLVYWNMLAPRACPPGCRDRVRPLTELAAGLHARDRAWFYGAFHVDEVVEAGR